MVDSIDLSWSMVIWNGNIGVNINLLRDWKFDLFGFVCFLQQMLQGENLSFWFYGMGLWKQFNKCFSFGICVIELFNECKSFFFEIQGENFYQCFNFSILFCLIGFSISYNFGELDFSGNCCGCCFKINNDDQKGGGNDNFQRLGVIIFFWQLSYCDVVC